MPVPSLISLVVSADVKQHRQRSRCGFTADGGMRGMCVGVGVGGRAGHEWGGAGGTRAVSASAVPDGRISSQPALLHPPRLTCSRYYRPVSYTMPWAGRSESVRCAGAGAGVSLRMQPAPWRAGDDVQHLPIHPEQAEVLSGVALPREELV